MSKTVIIALVLLALATIVLIITQDKVDINLIGFKLENVRASFVYLGWMVFGVLVGALLH
jgi:hypothetical protein